MNKFKIGDKVVWFDPVYPSLSDGNVYTVIKVEDNGRFYLEWVDATGIKQGGLPAVAFKIVNFRLYNPDYTTDLAEYIFKRHTENSYLDNDWADGYVAALEHVLSHMGYKIVPETVVPARLEKK